MGLLFINAKDIFDHFNTTVKTFLQTTPKNLTNTDKLNLLETMINKPFFASKKFAKFFPIPRLIFGPLWTYALKYLHSIANCRVAGHKRGRSQTTLTSLGEGGLAIRQRYYIRLCFKHVNEGKG